jgi:hypothetical protein
MTIKELMVHVLEYTYEKESWQPSLSMAVEGLNVQQAAWKPAPERHSIGQIVRHVILWKKALLQSWNGEELDYDSLHHADWGDFAASDAEWKANLDELRSVSSELKAHLQQMDESTVITSLKWFNTDRLPPHMLIRVGLHDIYHAGQIRYLRALQGA